MVVDGGGWLWMVVEETIIGLDALKTTSKTVVHKGAEATG